MEQSYHDSNHQTLFEENLEDLEKVQEDLEKHVSAGVFPTRNNDQGQGESEKEEEVGEVGEKDENDRISKAILKEKQQQGRRRTSGNVTTCSFPMCGGRCRINIRECD